MKKGNKTVRTLTGVLAASILAAACTLAVPSETVREAYEIAANEAYTNHGLSTYRTTSVIENLEPGWLLDNRGGTLRRDIEQEITALTDVSITEGTALIREFNTLRDEILTADFTLKTVGDDLFVQFTDDDGVPVWRASLKDLQWTVLMPDGSERVLRGNARDNDYTFRVIIDLTAGTAHTYINQVDYGYSDLLSDNVADFRFATGAAGTPTLIPGRFYLSANYALNESFDCIPYPWPSKLEMPTVYGWQKTGTVNISENTLTLTGKASVTVPFSLPAEPYVFEAYVLVPGDHSRQLTLCNGSAPVYTFLFDRGQLYFGDGGMYDLVENVWYRLRVEDDPAASSATVKLNGRVIGTALRESSGVPDRMLFTQEQTAGSTASASLDNLRAYAVPARDDYVPAPTTRANLDDRIVIINSCNLWRDGFGGWPAITPFAEAKPVLGWYDEGNSETADWEIKYLVEHGVDAQAFCWYYEGAADKPVHTPKHVEHLYAYQNARYSDHMKYCILVECKSGQSFSLDTFKNCIVPYWFENFFTDDRYLTIDNMPVLPFFRASQLLESRYFGSTDNFEDAIVFLWQTAQNYGFDGIFFLADENIPGVNRYAYGWGANGCQYGYNVRKNEEAAAEGEANGYYMIPTASVGYGGVAWFHSRAPMMTADNLKNTLRWIRDVYIPAHAGASTWQEKTVWLSNWNEYGEGTFLMPAGLNGFGYLDAVKEILDPDAPAAENVVPTQAQKARICHMFPQRQTMLSRLFGEDLTAESADILGFVQGVSISKSYGVADLSTEDGALTGTAASNDPQLTYGTTGSGSLVTGVSDIAQIDRVRIDMTVDADNKMQLYFGIGGGALSEGNSVSVFSDTEARRSYYFPTEGLASKSGALNSLRFDPSNVTGASFTVYGIYLERTDGRVEKVYVNGEALDSDVPPETANGKKFFAFDPRTAVHYRLNTLMHWFADEGKLVLEGARGRKAVFTVGADTYEANGDVRSLGYTLGTRDGLPMMTYEEIADALGFLYETTEDGDVLLSLPPAGSVIVTAATYNEKKASCTVLLSDEESLPLTAVVAFTDADGRLVAAKTACTDKNVAVMHVTASLPQNTFHKATLYLFDGDMRPLISPTELAFEASGDTDYDVGALFAKAESAVG